MKIVRSALLGTCLVGTFGWAAVQSTKNLELLTVPEDRLPVGCNLKAAEAKPPMGPQGAIVVTSGQRWPVTPTNPWSGSDRRLAAAIRRQVDGTPLEPDGPPLDWRASEAWSLKWADNVVEAYRATYHAPDESLIDVFAIRFSDEALALPTPPAGTRNQPRGVNSRVVLGPTVVLVSAAVSSSCFQAIDKYVRSLR